MNWDWEKLQGKKQKHGQQVPGFTQVTEKLNKLKTIKLPGGKIIILAVFVIWLATGIYVVDPGEVGVVQRFGAYHRITDPGPHFHLPIPFERVQVTNVSQVRRFEIGFRTVAAPADQAAPEIRVVPEESHMLTGDENIVDLRFIVQYNLHDPVKYLFNVRNPDAAVKNVAESAIREIIGYHKLETILTYGKSIIQDETRALMQNIMDRYESGIQILAVQLQSVQPPEAVIDAFRDVVRAMEDSVRITNQAEAYRNDIIPRARGDAAAIVNQAKAHRETTVSRAQGEAQRFLAILAEYKQAPEVTRKRLYLETMEIILNNTELTKTIISDHAMDQVLPYLPLERIRTHALQTPDAPQAPQALQPLTVIDQARVHGERTRYAIP
jgi:membrane protease subunit HflK